MEVTYRNFFASKSAHISGTLTAGDENGFAATFYAGKIHRNVFVNSLDVNFTSAITIDTSNRKPYWNRQCNIVPLKS